MSSRPSTTDSSGHGTAQGGSFVTLESARYLLLTTFKPEGTPMAVPVRVVIDGDRAYFGVRAGSGTSKRLRRTDWVQVVRSTPLGMASFGPRIGATARPLAGAEARQAAARLAHARPGWLEFAGSLARRVTKQRIAYYELRPDEFAKEPAPPPAVTARVAQTRRAPDKRRLPPLPLGNQVQVDRRPGEGARRGGPADLSG